MSQWFTNPAPNPNNIVNNSAASPQELVEPVGQLSFAVQEPNQSARTYEVPVFEEAGLVSTNWTLPNACEQALQNAGHRVVREQNIVPVDLPDGRQVVVPVERVRVIPMMSAEVY